MIRSKTLLISPFVFQQAKIAAELDQFDCAETWIEATLLRVLEERPQIADLAKRRADKRKEADREWKEANQISE